MSHDIASRAQNLNDLELATLLCLIAQHHCIIKTDEASLSDAANQLRQSCLSTLNLTSCVIVDCSDGCSLEDFREGVLEDEAITQERTRERSPGTIPPLSLDERLIANVVIACHLDRALSDVQTQALELLRTGRIFTRAAMHGASKVFHFVALNSIDSALSMPKHLNEMFGMCHTHDSAVQIEGLHRRRSWNSSSSLSSRPSSLSTINQPRRRSTGFSTTELLELCKLSNEVVMTAEVETYMRNIVVTARLHRNVVGGISAAATIQLRTTCQALAVLHGLSYVTPALVDMGVRKTYLHRLVLADAHTERTLQWGSDPDAVAKHLEGATIENTLDSIIETVDTPL